jgi:hypothetical protein
MEASVLCFLEPGYDRFADNDYLCKEQDVPQLYSGEEQT